MKRPILVSAAVLLTALASAQVVVPGDRANTAGTSTFLYFTTTNRTYQYIINASQLTGLIGQEIESFSVRLPPSATADWPGAGQTFSYNDYQVTMGASVSAANRSLTFNDNLVGTQTLVRSGALTLEAGAMTSGSSPNAFGATVGVNPYLYTGGNLAITIRYTGVTSTAGTRSIDAIGTSVPPYLTEVSFQWATGENAISGSQGNFPILQLNPVPEPATMLALGAGLAAVAARRRRSSK